MAAARTMYVHKPHARRPAIVFLHGAGASGGCGASTWPTWAIGPLPVAGPTGLRRSAARAAHGRRDADLVADLIEPACPGGTLMSWGSMGGGVTHRLLGRRPELVGAAVPSTAPASSPPRRIADPARRRGGIPVPPHPPGRRPVQPDHQDGRGWPGPAARRVPRASARHREELQGRRLQRRDRRAVATLLTAGEADRRSDRPTRRRQR